MAITLLNQYIAVNNTTNLEDRVWRGTVRKVASGVTTIAAGDTIFFAKDKGVVTTANGEEYVLVKPADVMGKVS